jgi:hypothetical protein
MIHRALIALCTAATLAAAAGCSDDTEGDPSSGSASTGTSTTGAGGAPGDSDVVLNEISASGDDWVEITNVGAAPFDLGGYAVADADMGMPKVADAVRFPAGTTLGAGEFLLLLGQQQTAPPGPQTTCLPGGPDTCYYATWGISGSNGERLYILSAEDAVVSIADYPANAVPLGQTWGRLPDGRGDFGPNAPTPGDANQGP